DSFQEEAVHGHFDDALRSAKTMFAMSRHMGEHPTLIGDLVAIAIAYVAIGPLEEMLEQPGCPNLYWALTNLPNPLIPLDKGMEGERASLLTDFRDLDERAPMSVDQLQKFIAHWELWFGDGKLPRPGEGRVRTWLQARTKDAGMVGAALRRLAESGLPEERLRRFPADQVILLDEKRALDVRFDDLMKITTLPAWQAEALVARSGSIKDPALFADALVPAEYGVYPKRWRLDQRIALLRHVEALRLYAAEHNATLPARLSETPVPLPDDPFTGRPFRYEVHGNTAHLRGGPPHGMEKEPAFNVHYEVTLQK